MGKLGDLWINLGVKKNDLEKGLTSAKSKLGGFGKSFGSLATVAKAGFAVIGAMAVKVASQVVRGSQTMSDAWDKGVAQMKAGWSVFIQSVSNWDWKNFGDRIRMATSSAKELAEVMDSTFEVQNSLTIARAKNAEVLEQLRLDMNDQTKSYAERKASAEKYLSMVKPLYDKEIKMYADVRDAHAKAWMEQRGISTEGREGQMTEYLERFLQEDAENAKTLSKLYNEMQDGGTSKSRWEKLGRYFANYSDDSGYNAVVGALANAYQGHSNDADITAVTEAIEKYYSSRGSYMSENRKVFNAMHTASAGIGKEFEKSLTEQVPDLGILGERALSKALESIDRDIENIAGIDTITNKFDKLATSVEALPDGFKAWGDAMEDTATKMSAFMEAGDMLDSAIEDGIINGLDELANALAGVEGANFGSVVKAMLSPLADASITAGTIILTSGEALEAFKKAFSTLGGKGAIIAGTALVALGVSAKAGLSAIGKGSSSSGGYTSSSTGSLGQVEAQELTIYVKGELKGSDIALSYDRQKSSWLR